MEPNTGKAIGSNKSAVWDPTVEGDGLKPANGPGDQSRSVKSPPAFWNWNGEVSVTCLPSNKLTCDYKAQK